MLIQHPTDPRLREHLDLRLDIITSDWAHAIATFNVAKAIMSTLLFVKVIESCQNQEHLSAEIKFLVSTLINKHIKNVYQCLTSNEKKLRVAALKLLKALADFGQGSYAGELYSAIDLDIPVFVQSLNQKSTRDWFLDFYTTLIRRLPTSVQIDLISQRRIFGSWFSKLPDDTDDTILKTLSLLESSAIKNEHLSKTAKMKLFNDWVLRVLSQLLLRQGKVAERTSNLLWVLFNDSEFGINFVDSGFYGEMHNKQAFSLLKTLKPWNSHAQMDLIIKFLDSMPELITPYFGFLRQNYVLTPRVTMFWFAFVTFHIRVVQLQLPNFDPVIPPPSEAVTNCILPPTATKACLNAAVTFEKSALVKFQSLQLVLSSLRKLKSLNNLYEERLWDASGISSEVMHRMVDVHLLTKISQPELLKTLSLECLRMYLELYPAKISIPQKLSSVMDVEYATGEALIQAMNLLEIHIFLGNQTKWWISSDNNHSFFVQLVRFALFNPVLTTRCVKILEFLTESTLLFQRDTLASAADILIYTLESYIPRVRPIARDLLWLLIDNTVSHCMRTPFYYIDKFPTRLSPFATALAEQYDRIGECDPDHDVANFILYFLRNLKTIGEDEGAINCLSALFNSYINLPALSLNNCYEFLLNAPSSTLKARRDLKKKIAGKIEFMAAIERAQKCPNDSDFLFSMIPESLNYCLMSRTCLEKVLKKDVISSYLKTLRDRGLNSPLVTKFIESSHLWTYALDFVSSEFLLTCLRRHCSKTNEIILELTRRQVPIPKDLIVNYLDFADNLRLQHFTVEEAIDLMPKISNPKSLCAIIEASGVFNNDCKNCNSFEVLAKASIYARKYMTDASIAMALTMAFDNIDIAPHEALKVFLVWKDRLPPQTQEAILERVSMDDWRLLPEMPEVIGVFARSDMVINWYQSVIQELTRRIKQGDYNFYAFLKNFNRYLLIEGSNCLWDIVHPKNLNSFIEALSSCSDINDDLLNLLGHLVFSAVSLDALDSYQFLSHFLRTLSGLSAITFEHSLIVWRLFNFDPLSNSTSEIQNLVVLTYTGMNSAKDNLLLEILRKIEHHRQHSWLDIVTSWEIRKANTFDSDDNSKIASQTSKGLHLTLHKSKLIESVLNYDPEASASFKCSLDISWKQALAKMRNYDICYHNGGYNDEFIVNVLAGLYSQIDSRYFHVSELIESGLLSVVFIATSSMKQVVLEAAKRDLMFYINLDTMQSGTVASCESYYPVRMLTCKLLHYLSSRQRLSPCLAILMAKLVPVLADPGHLLFNKTTDWLLASPTVRDLDLPLFRTITHSCSFLREYEETWLLDALCDASVDSVSVNQLITHGAIEWTFANMSTESHRLTVFQNSIKRLRQKLVRTGGNLHLVKRSGALIWPCPTYESLLSVSIFELIEWMGLNREVISKKTNGTTCKLANTD